MLNRRLDILFSSLFMVLLSPVFVIVAVAVWLTSPGHILYRQERVGLDGKPFGMLKFRTMRGGAEEEGPTFARTQDARATSLGAILRRLSLDELPQLWNVLIGEMSLVAPRPGRRDFIARLRRR